MRLRRIVFFCLPILLLLQAGSPRTGEADFIDWDADRKLTWTDFTGKPESGTDRAALSSIQIHIDFQFANNDLQWNIRCRFNKKKSWGKTRTDYILAHEQAHFDITEIHARKLHERYLAYKKTNGKDHSKELQRIYQQTMTEENEMQTAYDRETNHSIRKEQQELWLKKVDSLIQATREFSGYRQDQNKP